MSGRLVRIKRDVGGTDDEHNARASGTPFGEV